MGYTTPLFILLRTWVSELNVLAYDYHALNWPMLIGQVFMKFEPIFTFFVLKALEMQLNMIKSSQPINDN